MSLIKIINFIIFKARIAVDMKSFSYNAYDSQGVKTSGVLEAASHAEAKIRSYNVHILLILKTNQECTFLTWKLVSKNC